MIEEPGPHIVFWSVMSHVCGKTGVLWLFVARMLDENFEEYSVQRCVNCCFLNLFHRKIAQLDREVVKNPAEVNR